MRRFIVRMLKDSTGQLLLDFGARASRSASSTRKRRGETGVRIFGESAQRRIEGGVPVEEAIECNYDNAHLHAPILAGICEFTSFRDAIIERPSTLGSQPSLSGCVLDGAVVEDGELSSLRIHASRLEDTRVCHTQLGALTLCDLRRCRMEDVVIRRLSGCNLNGAHLVRCDLRGTDLRGSSFRRTTLTECQLDGALVDGVGFLGVRGLSESQIETIREGGGHTATLLPRSVWVLAVLALIIYAILPSSKPAMPHAPLAQRSIPSEQELQSTRNSLERFRERLNHAHKTMKTSGAINRTWPTIRDVQQNRYDMDGDGAGESWDLIATEGPPPNHLTHAEGGILPFCKEEPSQTDLAHVDTDWYYCELNGRLFAAAGFSDVATLNW